MKKAIVFAFVAVILVSGTTTKAPCGGPKQACYRSCVDCRTRCKGDEACRRTCYQIKRSCCMSNGHGGGPHQDCICT